MRRWKHTSSVFWAHALVHTTAYVRWKHDVYIYIWCSRQSSRLNNSYRQVTSACATLHFARAACTPRARGLWWRLRRGPHAVCDWIWPAIWLMPLRESKFRGRNFAATLPHRRARNFWLMDLAPTDSCAELRKLTQIAVWWISLPAWHQNYDPWCMQFAEFNWWLLIFKDSCS